MSEEQDNKALAQAVKELTRLQQTRHHWDLAFRIIKYSVVLIFFLALMLGGEQQGLEVPHGEHVALIDIEGAIDSHQVASADNIIGSLRAAMEARHSLAVILRINSPGGSPVQAGYVYDEIKRLRGLYPKKKIYAVITDVGASAAYYIASAADEIYANQASIVGSIGVTMNGLSLGSFGYTGAMEKLGIERRLMTSGESKAFLDPFSPLKAEDVRHYKQLLGEVHQQFIERVKQGRGERLKQSRQLFSGLFWTGAQSQQMGLVDGLGSSAYVARELIGNEQIFDYTQRPGVFERFAEQLGSGAAKAMLQLGLDRTLELR